MSEATVYIGISKGQSIGLNSTNELIIMQQLSHTSIHITNLGPFTKQRCKELKEYLDRLAIHVE